jgi:glutamate dehydrogenase/leucine dehydrogenase
MNIRKKVTIAINGFGNVGANFARIAEEEGKLVVAVSDSKGGVYNPKGLDIGKVEKHKVKTGSVIDFPGAENISNEDLLNLEVDVLVPAALENVIRKDNYEGIKARIILELANGPVGKEASLKLFQKGIVIIPDVLANAGGVVVSYFEWVQNLANFYWTLEEVLDRLKLKMNEATDKIWKFKENNQVDMRTGAYVLAVKKILKAIQARNL